MAKKIEKQLKLQIPGGEATPAPPLGPALGQAGVNIGEFVNQFNEQTQELKGQKVSIVLTIFDDRSFEFTVKTPLTSSLIKKAAGIEKGSGKNTVKKAGSITDAQVAEIAEEKMPDLNAHSIDEAKKIVAGTCRSMGVEVKG